MNSIKINSNGLVRHAATVANTALIFAPWMGDPSLAPLLLPLFENNPIVDAAIEILLLELYDAWKRGDLSEEGVRKFVREFQRFGVEAYRLVQKPTFTLWKRSRLVLRPTVVVDRESGAKKVELTNVSSPASTNLVPILSADREGLIVRATPKKDMEKLLTKQPLAFAA